ncbi:MAG: hypothetical protein JKX96_11235 [Acinetobacter sp.]|nr:hypothetical protein [Acinetobacter sp.]
MCEPVTLTALGMSASAAATTASVMQVAGLAFSAYGAYQKSQATKDQADYQSAVARNNKIVSDRNAVAITKQGKDEANRYRSRVRQLEANQIVGLVGQGVDVTEGTSVDLLADTAELGEFDAQTIESNAGRASYNARVQGMNFESQAGLYRAKANAQSPAFSAGTTLLSGAGQVADRWVSTRKAKV